MSEQPNRILVKMLDRLFAALVSGPSLNCRPYNSRQRMDLSSLARFKDIAPEQVLRDILGEKHAAKVTARVPQPPKKLLKKRGELNESGDDEFLESEAGEEVEESDGGEESAAKPETAPEAEKDAPSEKGSGLTPEEQKAVQAWDEQQALLNKLLVIADDAKTYEQDTGVHVLNIGFPLLSLPPGTFGGQTAGITRRIIAPVAFISVTLNVKHGPTRSVEIAAKSKGMDLVSPNGALLAWLERETGQPRAELFSDETGKEPWREISELVRRVCQLVNLPTPTMFIPPPLDLDGPSYEFASVQGQKLVGKIGGLDDGLGEALGQGLRQGLGQGLGQAPGLGAAPALPAAPPEPPKPKVEQIPADLALTPAPRQDDDEQKPALLMSAVLGLFTTSNQGLLRDMQAMVEEGDSLTGPVRNFLKEDATIRTQRSGQGAAEAATPGADGDASGKGSATEGSGEATGRSFEDERLVTQADPFQSRAVKLARQSEALVIHGPPGTGKSQTIANIIGDHLSRMQRVLLVCDKRTALDVVYNRLEHMGLAKLCALVHDPQRDQADLYRNLRQQLDELAEALLDDRAEARLAKVDAELSRLHDELTRYHTSVMGRDASGRSFHELVGEWLSLAASAAAEDGGTGASLVRSSGDTGEAPVPQEQESGPNPLHDITLEELDKHTQDLRETLSRAEAISYTTNPWKDAPEMTLSDFLKKPMQALRGALANCVKEAKGLDATNDPVVPPFLPKLDPIRQANARIALADDIDKLVHDSDPVILMRWAPQEPAVIERERNRLETIKPLIETFRNTPLDADLLAKIRGHVPAVGAITQAHGIIKAYAEAYRAWADRFDEVKKLAPKADIKTITQWLGQDPVKLSEVLNRMEALEPLAGEARGKPLDHDLLITYRRNPVEPKDILAWTTLLDAYIQNSSKWYAFLWRSGRKAALPAAAHFGVGLTPQTAKQLREFLGALRQRVDLHDEMKRILPNIPDKLPEDQQLLGTFFDTIGILRALTKQLIPGPEHIPTAPPDVIHPLIPREVAAVTPLLANYGLSANPEHVHKLRTFLKGLHARLLLSDLHHALTQTAPSGLVEDVALDKSLRAHQDLFDLLTRVRADELLSVLAPRLAAALTDPGARVEFISGLRGSAERADALDRFRETMKSSDLFCTPWLIATDERFRAAEMAEPFFNELWDKIDTLDHVLRIRHSLGALPEGLRQTIQPLLARTENASAAFDAVRKTVLGAEIKRRLAADPQMYAVDAQRIQAGFDRFEKLQEQKRELSRDVLLNKWMTVQKNRLLVPKATRMNRAGADLRRRLTSRGEYALRLRQVIASYMSNFTSEAEREDGADATPAVAAPLDAAPSNAAGGGAPDGTPDAAQQAVQEAVHAALSNKTIDPLFDLAPVWMASPETVAQIFPRMPLFDVVIFDEASQCRLEEALPVLTRGKRVVIAGDPKQLPPTRFFETALQGPDEEYEPQNEQALFEKHQSEIEDLLEAALGLQIDECYLEVHYRSKHADLIEFSNEHFYQARLQPIPGHPSRQPKTAPVRLYQVDGLYDKRRNIPEAEQVVEIVKELLMRPKPPSIGIACFNLPQRDLILELLDEAAEEDTDFEKALEAAYERTGEGSFEGLFVKNLENVQGDERDHMIISTTYGPDKQGKFYRRFGPLGFAGGGRRLNVLVTRAREQVHLVSSIPASQYRTLPQVPEGQAPSGAYLLFAYLHYAYRLTSEYATDSAARSAAEQLQSSDVRLPTPQVLASKTPSTFALALAENLAQQYGVPADVHWGNEGFAIDLAIHHPDKQEQVVLGLLCDGTRFTAAADPVEWDIFRTSILETQGWKLHRVWSPHFFRDPEGTMQQAFRAAHIRPKGPKALVES